MSSQWGWGFVWGVASSWLGAAIGIWLMANVL